MIYLKNGNIPLNFAFDDEIVQEANSTYQLTFKFPVSDDLFKELKEEVLLLADDLHGEQEFVVFEIVNNHGYCTVYANQVASLLNSYSISELSVDRVTGTRVMTVLAGSIVRDNEFSLSSDIEDEHTLNLKNTSAMNALAKDKHSIIGQWGGDLVRDKYDIRLLKNGGSENESLFMYKKNMKSYTQNKSIKELRTRIHFHKKLESKEGSSEESISVTVDSPLINKYQNVYEYDLEVNDQDVTDLRTLTEYGKKYFRETLCDVIEESIEIDVVGVNDINVRIFDVVSIFHENFNIDIRKKVSKYRYSPMGKKLKSIGFGKVQQGLASTISGIVNDEVSNQTRYISSDIDARVKKELKNADLAFDRKAEKLKESINDGIEESKAKAEEFKATIREEIERDKEEVLGRVRETTTDFNRRLEESKRELSNSSGRGINAEVREALERYKRDSTIEANNLFLEAKSEARAIKDKVDNLKVGGRNLALRTSDEWGNTYSNFSGSTNHLIKLYKILNKDLKLGDTLYLKIYIECSDIVGNNGRNPSLLIQSRGNITGWNTGALYQPSIRNVENGAYELEKKFIINENHLRNEFWTMYIRTDHIQSGSIRIKSCKVENGTVSTPWSPAPEDYMHELEKLDAGYREKFTSLEAKDRELDTFKTEINRTVSGISQGVSNINQKFDSSGELLSLKHYKSQVEQKDREITTKLTALEQYKNQDGTRQTTLLSLAERKTNELLNREISRLSDTYVAKSTLTETIRGSERKILESIKISNFNLLKNANAPINEITNYWVGSYPLAEPIEDGEEVTLTIKVKFSDDRTKSLMPYNSGGSVNFGFDFRLSEGEDSNKYHILSKTFRWRSIHPGNGATANNTKLDFYHYFSNNPKPISIAWATLVRGKVGTVEWIPSKFDSEKAITDRLATYRREVDNSLTELRGIATDGQSKASRLEQTLSGVSTTVSSLSGRLDNLKVGGRNYIKSYGSFGISLVPFNHPNWTYELLDDSSAKSGKVIKLTALKNTSGPWFHGFDFLKNTEFQNRELTWSLEIKSNKNFTSNEIGFETGGVTTKSITTEFQRISHTFINNFTRWWSFVIYGHNFTQGDTIYLRDPQLEDGSVATTPRPAPEDEPTALTLYKTERQQTDRQILDKVTTLENGTFKKSEFRQTDDKIILAAGYEISNRKLASMISVSPEAVQAITDKMIITPYNENLVSVDKRSLIRSTERNTFVSEFFTSPLDDYMQFLIEGDFEKKVVGSNPDVKIMIQVVLKNGREEWPQQMILSNASIISEAQGKTSVSFTFDPFIRSNYLSVGISKWRFAILQDTNSNFATWEITNLKIYQKKSASLIVDGSITADQIKAKAVNAGHLAAGAVTSEKILSGAVEAKHLKVDAALIEKLVAGEALISKLLAKQAFINRLNAITINASQIKGGLISGDMISGGVIRGTTIEGVTIQGSSKIKIGTHGFLKPAETGLQICSPATAGARNGVGMQLLGNYGRSGNSPYGLYLYVDPDFYSTKVDSTDSYLMTVNGYIKARGINNLKITNDSKGVSIGYYWHSRSKDFGLYFGSVESDERDVFYEWDDTCYSLWYLFKNSESDLKLKTNIVDCENSGLSIINELNFKSFDWIDSLTQSRKGSVGIGLIAQDLEKIDNNLVYKNGNFLSVDNFKMLTIALKAIQELSQENKSMKEEIRILKEKAA